MKTWIAILLIFISGIVIGGVGGALWMRRQMLEPSERAAAMRQDFLMRRLTGELELSPEQQTTISAIIATSQTAFTILRRDIWTETGTVLSNANAQIMQCLTPEQQERYRKMAERVPRPPRFRRGPPPPLPPPPRPPRGR